MSNTETKQASDLDPWYYQVEIDGEKVEPGVGSKQSAKELIARQKYRAKMLLKPVLIRYNFNGKSVLDVACNCAYWSNEYVKAGAETVVGFEGREKYVQQAEMYHASERRKDGREDMSEFFPIDVGDLDEWKKGLRWATQDEYDFVLCAGILYHVTDFRRVLRASCQAAKEAILIDTRSTFKKAKKKIKEPGGWCFDGIGDNVFKCNPNYNSICNILTEQGFSSIIRFTSAGPVPAEMKHNDDYNEGQRVTILARRA